MRNMYLTATEERIRRIRFYKSFGKAIYGIIILTLIIILFVKLDTVMKMQVDALDQIMEIRMGQEIAEEAGSKIEGLSEFNLTD